MLIPSAEQNIEYTAFNKASMFYPYTDHLGSILKITDASGNIVHEQNFDAWGRKRDPQDWDYDFNDIVPYPYHRALTTPTNGLFADLQGMSSLMSLRL